jgi:hypothetical protein
MMQPPNTEHGDSDRQQMCVSSLCFIALHVDDLRDSTQRNATSSPLLKLPGELRNHIYEYVFAGQIYRPISPVCNNSVPDQGRMQHSLLRTCRQTNAEAKHLPLALGTISIGDFDDLQKILIYMSPHQRDTLSSVIFQEKEYQYLTYWKRGGLAHSNPWNWESLRRALLGFEHGKGPSGSLSGLKLVRVRVENRPFRQHPWVPTEREMAFTIRSMDVFRQRIENSFTIQKPELRVICEFL